LASVLTATQAAVVDDAVAELARGESAWAKLDLTRRRRLLEQVHAAVGAHAGAWVRAAATYKRLDDDSPYLGEEWLSGPYAIMTATATLARSVGALEKGLSPVDGLRFGRAPGDRVTVRVHPGSVYDRLLLNGFRVDVWMPPGVSVRDVRTRAGLAQRQPARTAGIGAVLGAGNITSIPILDVLSELYAHNRVAALKLNPLTDVMLPVYEAILAPLLDIGAVRLLTGGADVGTYLIHHPNVDHVHLTGSVATHNAIVFGGGAEGAARRLARSPWLDKPVSSELGGVSPTIVVPGEWSRADLRFQAEHVATQRLHNGGYNCIATQVVLVSSDWAQKDEFVGELRAAMMAAPPRPAYYPGSDDRVASACAAYPGAKPIGGRLLLGLDRRGPGPALSDEYFAPVLGVLELPGDARRFLAAAVETANETFAGTLGANLVVHPATRRSLGTDWDDAITRLRYGTIAVNAWTAVGYLTPAASWGAFPGHTIDDVQSGIGVVHNALLLDRPERSVVRGPFRPAPRSLLHGEPALSPKPPWFVTNRTATTTGERLTAFAARPRWSALPGIFASALRG
jgi:aldehyde dehydrogenase (NAD(P)+)